MLFSDKLKTLMDITHTSNKLLAKHLIVDPSMISQLRTGARNISKKNDHLKNMADYFAGKCNSDSRIIELQDVIDDEHLDSECTVTELSDIILRFLSEDTTTQNKSQRVISEIFKANPRIRRTDLTPLEMPDRSLMVCHDAEEKKQYMKMLFEYYMAMEKPDVIYFSSEEIVEWIYADPVFYSDFRSWCLSLVEKGFTLIRIMKPMENKEHFLRNILLWLPVYMTGGVHLFYYPHYRDDIFRQTLIAVDNSASYFSSSIAKTDTCYYSFVSTNPSLSSAYVRQIKDYLAMCRPSMNICSTRQDISDTFTKAASLPGDRITKSFHLSANSLPYNEMLEYMSLSENEVYKSAAKVLSKIYGHKGESPFNSTVIEMCTIASVDDILTGKVRLYIPGYTNSVPIYYDKALYAMHIKHILYMLNTNPDYHFYPLDPLDFGEYASDYAPISVVDNQAVLVTTDNLMIHFVQPDIIRTLYEHLYIQATARAKYYHSREEITSMLMDRLRSLS